MFPRLIKYLPLIGLASILLAGIHCHADEGDENLSELQDQINVLSPYEALSDYLVEKKLSSNFVENHKVVKELAKQAGFETIKSEEFKKLVQLMAGLRTDYDESCERSNLANLRQLATKMQQFNVRPTEGAESRHRLNRLLIEFSERVYFKCVELLQTDWSQVDFNTVLLDDTSRAALAMLEVEVDFVQLIRSDYNPNLKNEYLFAQGVQCVLDQLHSKRTGESVKREREELTKLIDFYLIDSCRRLRQRLDSDGQRAEIVQKYLDLVTVAILMYPQVLTAEDKQRDFSEIRVKGVGRVVVCNKLLSGAGSEALVDKMLALARAQTHVSSSKRGCKLS